MFSNTTNNFESNKIKTNSKLITVEQKTTILNGIRRRGPAFMKALEQRKRIQITDLATRYSREGNFRTARDLTNDILKFLENRCQGSTNFLTDDDFEVGYNLFGDLSRENVVGENTLGRRIKVTWEYHNVNVKLGAGPMNQIMLKPAIESMVNERLLQRTDFHRLSGFTPDQLKSMKPDDHDKILTVLAAARGGQQKHTRIVKAILLYFDLLEGRQKVDTTINTIQYELNSIINTVFDEDQAYVYCETPLSHVYATFLYMMCESYPNNKIPSSQKHVTIPADAKKIKLVSYENISNVKVILTPRLAWASIVQYCSFNGLLHIIPECFLIACALRENMYLSSVVLPKVVSYTDLVRPCCVTFEGSTYHESLTNKAMIRACGRLFQLTAMVSIKELMTSAKCTTQKTFDWKEAALHKIKQLQNTMINLVKNNSTLNIIGAAPNLNWWNTLNVADIKRISKYSAMAGLWVFDQPTQGLLGGIINALHGGTKDRVNQSGGATRFSTSVVLNHEFIKGGIPESISTFPEGDYTLVLSHLSNALKQQKKVKFAEEEEDNWEEEEIEYKPDTFDTFNDASADYDSDSDIDSDDNSDDISLFGSYQSTHSTQSETNSLQGVEDSMNDRAVNDYFSNRVDENNSVGEQAKVDLDYEEKLKEVNALKEQILKEHKKNQERQEEERKRIEEEREVFRKEIEQRQAEIEIEANKVREELRLRSEYNKQRDKVEEVTAVVNTSVDENKEEYNEYKKENNIDTITLKQIIKPENTISYKIKSEDEDLKDRWFELVYKDYGLTNENTFLDNVKILVNRKINVFNAKKVSNLFEVVILNAIDPKLLDIEEKNWIKLLRLEIIKYISRLVTEKPKSKYSVTIDYDFNAKLRGKLEQSDGLLTNKEKAIYYGKRYNGMFGKIIAPYNHLCINDKFIKKLVDANIRDAANEADRIAKIFDIEGCLPENKILERYNGLRGFEETHKIKIYSWVIARYGTKFLYEKLVTTKKNRSIADRTGSSASWRGNIYDERMRVIETSIDVGEFICNIFKYRITKCLKKYTLRDSGGKDDKKTFYLMLKDVKKGYLAEGDGSSDDNADTYEILEDVRNTFNNVNELIEWYHTH